MSLPVNKLGIVKITAVEGYASGGTIYIRITGVQTNVNPPYATTSWTIWGDGYKKVASGTVHVGYASKGSTFTNTFAIGTVSSDYDSYKIIIT